MGKRNIVKLIASHEDQLKSERMIARVDELFKSVSRTYDAMVDTSVAIPYDQTMYTHKYYSADFLRRGDAVRSNPTQAKLLICLWMMVSLAINTVVVKVTDAPKYSSVYLGNSFSMDSCKVKARVAEGIKIEVDCNDILGNYKDIVTSFLADGPTAIFTEKLEAASEVWISKQGHGRVLNERFTSFKDVYDILKNTLELGDAAWPF